MYSSIVRVCAASALLGLAACGSDTQTSTVATSTARGTLIHNPPLRAASLNVADLTAEVTAAGLLPLSGAPVCGVDVNYIQYWTIDANGAAVTASAALMVPTPDAGDMSGQCTTSRPIVLYAHGTATAKNTNLADVSNNSEGALIAAVFAAKGYIVVAPNYVGYDTSSGTYHPYLVADQQSKDMIDALAAAKAALPVTMTFKNHGTTAGTRLFLTGYSQGGYVALATQRAIQSDAALIAANVTVTASAPMSGPYALLDFGDSVFFGAVNVYGTFFAPLLTTSYQHAYGNIYTTPSTVYEDPYAATVDGLLPSTTLDTTLVANGLLPASAMFSANTLDVGDAGVNALLAANMAAYSYGYGTGNLIKDSYRLSYLGDALINGPDPQLPFRAALARNDLRYWDPLTNSTTTTHWSPGAPVLLCGAGGDPTVFFPVNTGAMSNYWTAERGMSVGPGLNLVNVLDLAGSLAGHTPQNDPFYAAEAGFQQTIGAITDPVAQAQAYHRTVAPFCTAAARGVFDGILLLLGP